MGYWHTYRVLRELTPQEEHALLSDLDSMKGLGAVTYNTKTYRLMEFEVDSFSAWRIELARALTEQGWEPEIE